MSKSNAQEIDIDKIIRSRAGKRAKFIPGFVVSLMKRMIHIDFINTYLRKGYEGVEFCDNCLKYLNVDIQVEGLENLQKEGRRYTFVSNHPLGAIDGVTLGKVLGRHYNGRIKYLVNDLLMNLKGLAPLCVPINKIGGQSRNLPRLIDEAFKSDEQMIMFPAGICSRKIDGKIQDVPWTKAFITKSIESKRDIVPIHFVGRNSERFYRVASWCKILRMKFNLAMLLLPSEMYRSRGGTYRVIIGKPIPWQTFTPAMTSLQWAQEVRKKVYELSV
ncbi:MAG: 1-acyl-sn-glycerol-3-phosphate acyltransferase [Bacteroidales bacterium]|nr:1-acyl-sn-glycerol-3-phosphate acyltransferase [Clostridium sp.]MCM1502560.1 1-acyl-sn-glycerol-3-phosphate acyltransferase [Bacteroidales bacterium]